MALVTFKVYEPCIYQRVLNVSMSQHFHNVQDVFCLSVFRRGFPVSEAVKVDQLEIWVLQGSRQLVSCCRQSVLVNSAVWVEHVRIILSWHGFEHRNRFCRELQGSGV